MIYLILILIGIFAVWGSIYSYNNTQNKELLKNIEKYDKKEKTKQQKSKVS